MRRLATNQGQTCCDKQDSAHTMTRFPTISGMLLNLSIRISIEELAELTRLHYDGAGRLRSASVVDIEYTQLTRRLCSNFRIIFQL